MVRLIIPLNYCLSLLTIPCICWHVSRSRKIRCDSTRPHCNNCVRRGNECEYDAKPKRRGPDKRPGTRQRSCKKRAPEAEPPNGVARKKRKMESDDDDTMIAFDAGDGATNGAKQPLLASASPVPDEASGLRMPQAPPLVLETSVQARGITSEAIYPKVRGLSPRPRVLLCQLVFNSVVAGRALSSRATFSCVHLSLYAGLSYEPTHTPISRPSHATSRRATRTYTQNTFLRLCKRDVVG